MTEQIVLPDRYEEAWRGCLWTALVTPFMVPHPENLNHQARIFRTSSHARNTGMHNRGRIVACNR
jgi:hypothetical protein